MGTRRATTSIEIDVPRGTSHGLVLGLGQRFFELALQQPRFHLLVLGALAEVGVSLFGSLLQQNGRPVEIRSAGLATRRFVPDHLAELAVDFQPRAAARTNEFDR